jgi:hypothetical protein
MCKSPKTLSHASVTRAWKGTAAVYQTSETGIQNYLHEQLITCGGCKTHIVVGTRYLISS